MNIRKLLGKTKQKIAGEEVGFTLVELLIVMVISTIMLAGMVGLLVMGFQSFTQGHDLQSVTDASRRVLPAMNRQIASLLHINNDDECVASYQVTPPPDGVWDGMSFYSNVKNNLLGATVESYNNAEKVEFYLDANHNLIQRTTPPGVSPTVTTATLCSYVTSFRVYYFSPGIVPGTGTPPTNCLTGTNLNSGAGSVKIVVTIQKGTISRTFEQTTFLRVLQRSDTGV